MSRHGATPAKPWRAAASTASRMLHCLRTVARLSERSAVGTRSGPGEEVEIAAEIRLGDALDIEPAITARRLFRRLPGGTTARELGLVDQEIDLAGGGVEADTVAVAYQRERTAGGRFRRHVQHDGAERGAAHAR